MNWYYYWFYTIYSIYKKLSWDKHFDVFATGMFSFFVSCFVIGVLSIMTFLAGNPKLMFTSKYILPALFGIVFIINSMIFLPKTRQLKQYEKFIEKKNLIRTFMSITFSILSISLCIFVILLVRKLYI